MRYHGGKDIEPPPPPVVGISSFTLSPMSVVGGSTSQGTVALSLPAPAGGAVISLTSNNASVASRF